MKKTDLQHPALYLGKNPETSFKPLGRSNRIEILDALRGFAICGILLVNLPFLMGYYYLTSEQQAALPFAKADKIVLILIHFFIEGKFYSLFSLLFGIGFAVQLMRAGEKKSDFLPYYIRRLSILFLIGIAHLLLLWTGDILAAYALTGFVLLLLRNKSNQTLLIWALVLLSLPVIQYALVLAVEGKVQPGMIFAIAASLIKQELGLTGTRLSQLQGDYLSMVESNMVSACYRFEHLLYSGRFFKILAMFLLGFYAGREKLFSNPETHLPLIKKMIAGGLLLGLPANLVLTWLMELGGDTPPSMLGLVQTLVYMLGVVPLSLCYIALFTWAWQKEKWQSRLHFLVPVGKMALSNYLLQSVICVGVFNGIGLGLLGEFGPFTGLGIGAAILVFQVLISLWWLRHFQFGPLEWLWRCLTYRKLLSIKLKPAVSEVN